MHCVEVRVRSAQGLPHAGGDEIQASHHALVGAHVAVGAS